MELNTILNILTYYKLTADELLLVYLTLMSQDEENHKEFFSKWYMSLEKGKLKELFNSLKEKGIIHKNFSPDTYKPNDIEFNKAFIKSFYKQSGKLGEELFSNYPPFVFINGKNFSLRNIAKKFFSLEEFYFHYGKTIGHSIDKHKEIMELLQWAKENNHINYNILEFVISCKWNDIKLIKEGGINNTPTTYDIYQNL